MALKIFNDTFKIFSGIRTGDRIQLYESCTILCQAMLVGCELVTTHSVVYTLPQAQTGDQLTEPASHSESWWELAANKCLTLQTNAPRWSTTCHVGSQPVTTWRCMATEAPFKSLLKTEGAFKAKTSHNHLGITPALSASFHCRPSYLAAKFNRHCCALREQSCLSQLNFPLKKLNRAEHSYLKSSGVYNIVYIIS